MARAAEGTAAMNLRMQFRSLGFPEADAEFVAERIRDRADARLGRDRNGRAVVLIAHAGDRSPDGGGAAIELRHVSFLPSAQCEITATDGVRSGTFALVRWKSDPDHLQDLFLEVVGTWLGTLGESPSVHTLRPAFDRLAQLFAALDEPSSRDVTGLWGELLLIASSEDPATLVRAWRVDPHELHDFKAGAELLEVKATTGGIRRHDFSLAQLDCAADVRLIVASILLTSNAPTMTLLELVDRVKVRLPTNDLRLRVDGIVIATLGVSASSLLTQRYGGHTSASSLQFYDGADVPTVSRNLPAEVSDVRFKAELDGLEPLARGKMTAGPLSRAARSATKTGGGWA